MNKRHGDRPYIGHKERMLIWDTIAPTHLKIS